MKNKKCEICGSKDFKLLYILEDCNRRNKGVFKIVKCKKCKFVYLNPVLNRKELNKFYLSTCYKMDLNEKEKEGLSERYELINHFKKKGKILDIGAAQGFFLKFMKDKGWDVKGVELSKEACSFAKRKLNLNITNKDFIKTDLKNEKFDVMTMFEVMEHIPNINENLKKIYNHLKNKGVLIISVPNFNSLQRFIFGRYWCHIDVPRHLYHFTRKTIKKLLLNNGFVIEKTFGSLVLAKGNILSGLIKRLRQNIPSGNKKDKDIQSSLKGNPCLSCPSVLIGHPESYLISGFKTLDSRIRENDTKNDFFNSLNTYKIQFIKPISLMIRLLSFVTGTTGTMHIVARKR
ncbi:MAG: class I SAM-dependent methyltransferase [Candidatus Firestonebacteria bacterium]